MDKNVITKTLKTINQEIAQIQHKLDYIFMYNERDQCKKSNELMMDYLIQFCKDLKNSLNSMTNDVNKTQQQFENDKEQKQSPQNDFKSNINIQEKKTIQLPTHYTIQIENSKYQVLYIFQNSLLYTNLNNEGYYPDGIFYNTEYDKYENPIYSIIENYIIFKQGIFQSTQQSKLYKGKQIKYEIEKEEKVNENQVTNQQITKTDQNIKNDCWCAYNQLINLGDIDRLKKRLFLSSSILDAYCQYLNQQEAQFFFQSLQQVNDNNSNILKQRFKIFQSQLLNSFGDNFKISDHQINIFKSENLEYEHINYQIWKIFSKIGFIVNYKIHWFFILFDFIAKTATIYDSLCYNVTQYIKMLQDLFKTLGFDSEFKILIQFKNRLQQDGTSCGLFTCCFMTSIFNEYIGNTNVNNKIENMRQTLLNLIQIKQTV